MESRSTFLSTLSPGYGERRSALVVVLASLAVFLAAAPFAQVPLVPVNAFIPIYESALVINDLITAVLLFGQFSILRSRALLVLACAYLFTALMTVVHALTFPGVFAPSGLLGAGPQSTAWLYSFWHGGFPLCVIAYAQLKDRESDSLQAVARPWVAVVCGVAAAVVTAGGFTLLATAGQDALPAIMLKSQIAPSGHKVFSIVWMLSVMALAVLWRRKPHSVLDIWLMVVLCAWVFDIALSSVLNAGRFDVGFYVGRIFGLLAASFVLMVLLLENGKLYFRLVGAHERELGKSADLRRLGIQLENANDLLAEKNQQLEEAGRMKSEFLANMSHELRTPLNAIIGFSEVLRDGLLGELSVRQKEYVNDIFTSGNHLLALINDILDLSKVEAGKLTLELNALAAASLVKDSLQMLRETAMAHHLRLFSEVADDLGEICLDERRTKQILYNLLSNAIKFTPEGGEVHVTARRVGPATVPGGTFEHYLELSVRDTGIGISAADQARLFQPFVQIDSTLARRHQGTGLGLAMVKQLAELHGGAVALHSEPNKGSIFTVWLPWRTEGGKSDGVAASPVLTSGRGSAASASGTQALALVIEDNDKAAEILRLQLDGAGFRVVRALTADSALELLAREKPDLVTLDILLPGMDGWEFLERFKHHPQLAAVPVVIVSIVADRNRGLSLGAAQVLQKPVSREDLAHALAMIGFSVADGEQRTVLVVDDDPKAVQLLAAQLTAAGCRVLSAFGGQEGIDAARRQHPDLMVLDLMMPEVNGFDVVEALKQDAATESIPIVIVTAKQMTAKDRARLNGEVLKVIEKSDFNHGRFISEVRRAMTGKGK